MIPNTIILLIPWQVRFPILKVTKLNLEVPLTQLISDNASLEENGRN